MTQQRRAGRYEPGTVRSAPTPPAGYLGAPASLNIRTRVGAVSDPAEPHRRHQATIHTNVDVLERELAHDRISEAACAAGRELKRAYERLPTAASGSNWRGGDRIDPIEARNLKEDRHLDALAAVEAIEARAARVIGSSGVFFLRRVLRDGLTFGELAASSQARGSRADVAGVAFHFRKLLADLADGWAARGPER